MIILPTSTFFNLPKKKQKQVLDAAIKEFSLQPYSLASINQIVKNAGIAKGSFYQYFTGKEDLYTHLYRQITAEIEQTMAQELPQGGDESTLDLFVAKLRATARLNIQHPEYTRIAMLMQQDSDPFILGMQAASDGDRVRVGALFQRDIERGRVRVDIDVALLIDMLFTLSASEFFRAEGDEDVFCRRMESIVQMLRQGIDTAKEADVG